MYILLIAEDWSPAGGGGLMTPSHTCVTACLIALPIVREIPVGRTSPSWQAPIVVLVPLMPHSL